MTLSQKPSLLNLLRVQGWPEDNDLPVRMKFLFFCAAWLSDLKGLWLSLAIFGGKLAFAPISAEAQFHSRRSRDPLFWQRVLASFEESIRKAMTCGCT